MNFTLWSKIIILIGSILLTEGCKQSSEPPVVDNEVIPSHQFVWGKGDTINPPDAFQIMIRDIWGARHDNVWAVGHSDVVRNQAWFWNGQSWQSKNLSFPGHAHSLVSIYGFSENDIWAVGDQFRSNPPLENRNFIIHKTGDTWELIEGLDAPGCFSVWGTSSTNLFVGCDSGKILHFDGSQWSHQRTTTPYSQILEIWGFSNEVVFAVGGHPDFKQPGDTTFFYFYKLDETKRYWDTIDSLEVTAATPSPSFGLSLWGNGEKLFSASGRSVHQLKESGWEVLERFNAVRRIGGSAKNDFFVGGYRNEIHHYNGEDWFAFSDLSSQTHSIQAIWQIGDSVFVGSTNGFETVMFIGSREE